MAPKLKYRREDIIQKTYEIVKREGFDGINARGIAKELGCSIQPIFHNFATMDELLKEVYDRIYLKFKEYMLKGVDGEKTYKEMGIAYVKFAKDYPEFFKILFMQKTDLKVEDIIDVDILGKEAIKAGQILSGFTYEQHREFHVKVWIFTHGIACLVATKTVVLSNDDIERLIATTVKEMLIGYKKEMGI